MPTPFQAVFSTAFTLIFRKKKKTKTPVIGAFAFNSSYSNNNLSYKYFLINGTKPLWISPPAYPVFRPVSVVDKPDGSVLFIDDLLAFLIVVFCSVQDLLIIVEIMSAAIIKNLKPVSLGIGDYGP